MPSISIIPDGVSATKLSNSFKEPVSKSSIILAAELFPTPSIFSNLAIFLSFNFKGSLSSLKDALAIDFILNGFS
jgi:hypothetical protein